MLKKIIDITDLSRDEIKMIWSLAERIGPTQVEGTIAWSFAGNGIRTRTSFIKAFQTLGLNFIELPNLLKTSERPEDLAGYLDSFYEAYVIREPDHGKLTAFAEASKHPVINAMSDKAHPVEVLTDAFFIENKIKAVRSADILLWGPLTNVFLSWYALAEVMNFRIFHFCPEEFKTRNSFVEYVDPPIAKVDVVLTDGWPQGFSNNKYSLSTDLYKKLGEPYLLPTPPFTIGNEILFDPLKTTGFVGYNQKKLLVDIQCAILLSLLKN